MYLIENTLQANRADRISLSTLLATGAQTLSMD